MIPGLGRSPWIREWQPTPEFLPGEFNGQKSLVSYTPWGHKGSDTTEQLTLFFFFHILKSGKKYKTRQVQMVLNIKTDKELEAFQAFPVNK